MSTRKKIGIIGGMGPQATVDLFQKVVEITPAENDQQHVEMIIYNNPQIPDRTNAIKKLGPSPLPELIAAGNSLIKAGANILAMPCNTAHYFLPELKKRLKISFINMIEETTNYIIENHNMSNLIGLLATDGTIYSRIYHNQIENKDLQIITPDSQLQKRVMNVIYNVKKGTVNKEQAIIIHDIIKTMKGKGAEVIIAGCTELPHILKEYPVNISIPIISTTEVLARAIMREGKMQL